MPIKLQVIVGSTRAGRFSEKPALWILESAKKLEDVEAEIIDLRDFTLPFFDASMSPAYANGSYTQPDVGRWTKKIGEADGFIIVSPEYNHGYSAVLKNALDWVYQEWNNKPVGFISYGGVGGARSVEQLRLVAIELQMAPIRNAIHIPFDFIMQAQKEPTQSPAELLQSFNSKADEFLTQWLWWAHALKSAREKI